MADINETAEQVLNETAKNATSKVPATPEGMAVAYTSLLVMALLPIFFGSYRSVKYQKEQKVRGLTKTAVMEGETYVYQMFSIFKVPKIS